MLSAKSLMINRSESRKFIIVQNDLPSQSFGQD